MNNVLYRGIIIPAREASDGETPTAITVTREANGLAMWRESCEEGLVCLKHESFALDASYIESAVQMVLRERELAKRKVSA